eukprot:CAMPEP_0119048934 /NCGR_PEP_ID=MMETSP1177-20130426/61893_1 /TAXON_ID=2985 /ORGANISM="Ochromonas sp, Strain CCMP1899" /LENGTH=304 /DNA_ID=CAMNT_0007025503 /DNA_START=679 /DNA_END=1590 /DNA_ORIENTATION=-
MIDIWKTFLCDSQISLFGSIASPQALNNTRRRMNHFHLYGADVFSEAVIGALKVLHNDIFPRFLKSPTYAQMALRGYTIDCDELPVLLLASALNVEPPVSKIMDLAMSNLGYELSIEQGTRFKLQDILEDGILFNDFLYFLDTSPIYDSNSLLCSRMINLYYNLIDEAITQESEYEDEILTQNVVAPDLIQNVGATDQAWKIYEHFVAERSARQIPISSSMRIAIERNLALPTANMFVNIDAICTKDLEVQFSAYADIAEYETLVQRAYKTAYSNINRKTNVPKVRNRRCFNNFRMSKKFPSLW